MAKLACLLLASLTLLQGCAVLLVGAGVGTASVAHDRRSLGTQLDDTTLSNRVSLAISNNTELNKNARVNVEVFNGSVLLIGQTPTEQLRNTAEQVARGVPQVEKIHNQLRVATPVAASTITHDVWLANKVRAVLVADARIDGLNINVSVEDSEVFLMGMVSNKEADIAVEIVRNINGVARVVKAFEIQ